MSKHIKIEFTIDEIEFKQRFDDLVSKNSVFEFLNIINVPSASKGLQLISQNWFESKLCSHPQLIAIILKIDNIIDDLPGNLDLIYKNSILIAFQSTIGGHESKTYWKISGRDKFYSLDIDNDATDDVTSFCHEFMVDEIKNGRNGIIGNFQLKTKIRLQEIGDSDGRNLLVLATNKSKHKTVEILLNHDFDADDAINVAWKLFEEAVNDIEKKDQVNKIILSLLKANSRLPVDFEYEKASKEVKEFVDKCESLHKDVDEDAFEDLKKKLESEPNLIHFYDRNSQSLLAHALKMRKFKIFDLLGKEITTGCHEDLDKVYENMINKEKWSLRNQHRKNAKEFPETHIFVLRSRSKIGNNDRLSHKKWKFIDEAFEALNRNELCRKILKVAAEFKKLKIYFDFKHDSTYYLDPATSIYSHGIIYGGGSIFIGAKNLTDDGKKFSVFGVLAHELCHLAVYIAFMNPNFDPFPVGASANKTRFIDRVMVQCKERKNLEWIVANVFRSYKQIVQDSEMIVTVPQMLMHYVNDGDKIEELEGIFEELFQYCKEIVEPELDMALPVLKILGDDDNKSIKFKDLTEPMKAKVLHSKIIFQGSETTFNDLIGDDQEVLELLTSKDLRDILMRSFKLKIGEICQLNLKYGLTERFFVDRKVSSGLKKTVYAFELEKSRLNVEQIREDMKKSKIFILADHAGTGKSTIFKNCALKLKQSLPNFWISFINLRKCAKIFEKLPTNGLNSDMVLEMLLKIVNPASKLEMKIFTKLFAAGRAVLLFDGVDEICPKYTKILDEIFKILIKNDSKNEFWFSTRPHYAVKLEQFFQTSSFDFAPFTAEEKAKIIKNVLAANEIPEDQQNELCENIHINIKNFRINFGINFEGINNLMMIQMITELHIRDGGTINTENQFKLYELMFNQQKHEIGDKIPIEDHDKDSKLTVWDVHRILALELIFEGRLEQEKLSIFRKWKKEKKNWTSDMIQRYGFVIVELSDENLDTSIDFMHRTWAEFFVAQFLVNFVFDDDEDLNDVEVKILFKLFDKVMIDNFILSQVRHFIHSFLNYETKNLKINKKVKKLILKKISKIHEKLVSNKLNKAMESYALIGCIDAEIFRKFWKFDKRVNLLEEFVYNSDFNSLDIFMKSDKFSMYPNWHEMLNKSSTKLITDEEIEGFERDAANKRYWNADKNLLKFYDYVDKNFEYKVRRRIYDRIQSEIGRNSKIQIEIIQKFRNFFDRIEFVGKCLVTFDYYYWTFEALAFACGIIEEVFNFDHNSLNYLVFHHPHKLAMNLTTPPVEWPSPIVQAFEYENLQIHLFVKDFFMKYKNSMADIQNQILKSPGDKLIYPVDSLFYSEYKKLIDEVFGADKSKFAEKIETYVNEQFKRSYFEKNEQNLKDFMLFIFSDEDKAMEMFEKLNWAVRK